MLGRSEFRESNIFLDGELRTTVQQAWTPYRGERKAFCAVLWVLAIFFYLSNACQGLRRFSAKVQSFVRWGLFDREPIAQLRLVQECLPVVDLRWLQTDSFVLPFQESKDLECRADDPRDNDCILGQSCMGAVLASYQSVHSCTPWRRMPRRMESCAHECSVRFHIRLCSTSTKQPKKGQKESVREWWNRR